MIHAYDPEHTIQHHDDVFRKTTSDVDWMKELAGREDRWLVISGDLRILKNKAEAPVLRSSGLSFFALMAGWININLHEQAWKLVKVWPLVLETAEKVQRPTVFQIPVNAQKIDRYGFTADL